jgi:propionyl-CoA carboxylase alpha chain
MLAKLITYGETCEEAIQIMIKAIEEYQVEGVQTTLPLGNLF